MSEYVLDGKYVSEGDFLDYMESLKNEHEKAESAAKLLKELQAVHGGSDGAAEKPRNTELP